jgi:hypothetical protein
MIAFGVVLSLIASPWAASAASSWAIKVKAGSAVAAFVVGMAAATGNARQ